MRLVDRPPAVIESSKVIQEPVSARPPSVFYKLGKFTGRHRIGIAAAMLLVLALIAGMAGTTIGLMRARKAERSAQKEADKAKAINRFLQTILGSANPVEGRGRDITVLEALEASVSQIHESFIGQPEVEAELRFNIGITFLRLGHYDKAETLFKESLQIFQQQLGLERFGEKSQDVAKIRAKYGSCLVKLKNYDLAEQQLGTSFPILQDSLGVQDRWTQKVIGYLVDLYNARGNSEKAAKYQALLTPKP